nr:hypothetical protein [Tatlockia sp.]
ALTTEWQSVGSNGDWTVSYTQGIKEPIPGFYSLKSGILYSTDGSVNKFSNALIVSQRRDQHWYPIKINLVNYVKDDSELTPYDALPLTTEMAAERKRVEQEEQTARQAQQALKWKNYQDSDIHRRGMELSSTNSLFSEESQNLLLELLKTALFELDIKHYNCADYLELLKTIIENPANESHQKIISLAATTDMDEELGVGLPREELYPLKKSFYFDLLRAEAKHLSQEFNIESRILSEEEFNRKYPPKIIPARIVVNNQGDDFEDYWDFPMDNQNQANHYDDDQYGQIPQHNNNNNGQDIDLQRAITNSLEDHRGKSTGDEDTITQNAIMQAVSIAQVKYARWYKGGTARWDEVGTDLRGENGYFTFFRHGSDGQGRASDLKTKILLAQDLSSVIYEANHFLRADSTNYHRHSFASFLLDELTKVENSPWQGITCIENSNRLYDKTAVIGHLETRLMHTNIEI